MKINTVLFDLDGTLINTNELIIASFSHTLEQYFPGQYAREDIVEFIGEPLTESFQRIDPQRVDELVDVYRRHNIENHDRLVREYEGVHETVKSLHQQGYKLGIVTTKMRKTVSMGMKLAGLDKLIDTVVTFEDVRRAKPDPEPVNRALSLLGATAEHAIMVGDSPFDIEAGKNAGTYTAGVAWTIKGSDTLHSVGPDVMLESMPDLLDVLGVKVG
ncbi:MAG TPA: pyrophosphatase PpaX [Bacillales bacterium]|nr:pyrophosphatase PpaX [Bacillales bacterium]